jgi:hypothetical protein
MVPHALMLVTTPARNVRSMLTVAPHWLGWRGTYAGDPASELVAKCLTDHRHIYTYRSEKTPVSNHPAVTAKT